MAIGSVDLFACSVYLYLQAVNAAIDLNYKRLQIDSFAFQVYESGSCGFDISACGRNLSVEFRDDGAEAVQFAFEGQ